MTTPDNDQWTPGRYLRARRIAAGKSLADVAAVIGTDPHVDERARIALLELVEADEVAIELPIAAAMLTVFRFDPRVLVALVPPRPGAMPQLCRSCGCSWNDPCVDTELRSCSWIEPTLCSACSPPAQPAAVAA